ncbi:hypothetical protein F4778DRAFT_444592 [Xylariomycetidae sp. FL2044]|nr:hypothetical protein F4778DRAFT_444592 [Xylariomycetidae sp. FL2044]
MDEESRRTSAFPRPRQRSPYTTFSYSHTPSEIQRERRPRPMESMYLTCSHSAASTLRHTPPPFHAPLFSLYIPSCTPQYTYFYISTVSGCRISFLGSKGSPLHFVSVHYMWKNLVHLFALHPSNIQGRPFSLRSTAYTYLYYLCGDTHTLPPVPPSPSTPHPTLTPPWQHRLQFSHPLGAWPGTTLHCMHMMLSHPPLPPPSSHWPTSPQQADYHLMVRESKQVMGNDNRLFFGTCRKVSDF